MQHLDARRRRRGCRAARAGSQAVLGGHAPVRRPEVGVEHRLVGLDLGRGARGDDPAEVEHVDCGADLHDEGHVVLDEQDGHARRRPAREQAANATVSCSSWPEAGSSRSSTLRPGGERTGRARRAGTGRWAASRPGRRPRRRSPTRSMIVLDRLGAGSLLSPAPSRLRISAATRMFSRTVSEPNSSSRWNVRADAPAGPLGGGEARDVAAVEQDRPEVGACSPVMTLNRVVLPAPFGPMSPVIAPGSADSSTRRARRCRRSGR